MQHRADARRCWEHQVKTSATPPARTIPVPMAGMPLSGLKAAGDKVGNATKWRFCEKGVLFVDGQDRPGRRPTGILSVTRGYIRMSAQLAPDR